MECNVGTGATRTGGKPNHGHLLCYNKQVEFTSEGVHPEELCKSPIQFREEGSKVYVIFSVCRRRRLILLRFHYISFN